MKIAVEGCCHGELDNIYNAVAELEQRNSYKVDLLLICGDFEALRNPRDMNCMAVPQKYRHMGSFYKYYTGEKTAPILTLIIGGNHEASNYLWELFHGGWLAPNMYFLGFAGCVQVNGIRIAGASGIYNERNYSFGHFERVPFDDSSMRSVYHTREFDMFRLSQLTHPDVFMSHDWPNRIEPYGNMRDLFRRKPHFRRDFEEGRLGSKPLMPLLKKLKPHWWFAAHMHCRFEATVVHEPGWQPDVLPANSGEGKNPDEIVIDEEDDVVGTGSAAAIAGTGTEALSDQDQGKTTQENPDEIVLDEEMDTVVAAPAASNQQRRAVTRFLALDKCLPRRSFLEIIDFPTRDVGTSSNSSSRSTPRLTFDAEWLAITRAFQPYFSRVRGQRRLPDELKAVKMVEEERKWIEKNVSAGGVIDIEEVQKFSVTAPGPGRGDENTKYQPPERYINPQTVALCEVLCMEDRVNSV